MAAVKSLLKSLLTKYIHDASVFSWIIENIDTDLVNQYLDYPTAFELWKGIEMMYSSGKFGLQILDLLVKANTLKQGIDSIEIIYSKLVATRKEIDRRVPNPMKCPEDITMYNEIMQCNSTGHKCHIDILIQKVLGSNPIDYGIFTKF